MIWRVPIEEKKTMIKLKSEVISKTNEKIDSVIGKRRLRSWRHTPRKTPVLRLWHRKTLLQLLRQHTPEIIAAKFSDIWRYGAKGNGALVKKKVSDIIQQLDKISKAPGQHPYLCSRLH